MLIAVPRDLGANPHDQLASAHDLFRRGQIRTATAALLELRSTAPTGDPATTALLIECLLALGDLGTALSLGDELVSAGNLARAHHARGEIAYATGEPELAVQRFRAVPGGNGSDDLLLPWRAGAALALLHLGQRTEALELARAQHRLAEAEGTPYDVALGLRVLATTDPSFEATARRVPQLREALHLLDDVEAARLRAQIQTDLGGLLLLAGERDEALALLRAAEAYAGREDLWPLQSRVRRLLDRMGESHRRAASEALAVLTAAERRVAVLALEDLTNRQIAERLAVSVKAVEGHLSKIYRKLGVASRTALVASLG